MAIMSINDILRRSEEVVECAMNSYRTERAKQKFKDGTHPVLWIWYILGSHNLIVRKDDPGGDWVKVIDVPLTHTMTEIQVRIFLKQLARNLPLINRR